MKRSLEWVFDANAVMLAGGFVHGGKGLKKNKRERGRERKQISSHDLAFSLVQLIGADVWLSRLTHAYALN